MLLILEVDMVFAEELELGHESIVIIEPANVAEVCEQSVLVLEKFLRS